MAEAVKETPIPGGDSAAPVAAAVPTDAAVAPIPPATAASSDAPASAVEAAPAKADAKVEEKPETSPSLLETATGKPKPEAKADDAKAPEVKADEKASPEPAPADAKPDAKDAKIEGEKKPEAKADEAKKDEAKTDPVKDATADAQPPAPVKYEAFKVPDGIKLDEKKLGQFTEIIGGAQVKQEVAQSLMDLYVSERQADANAMAQEQRRVWNTLNDGWKSELRKDSVLGGNRLETSLSMAKAVVEEYGGSPEQVKDLLAHTSNNGMGNYPGFVRLLHNIGVAMNVFEDSIVPANPTAPKAEKGPGKRGWYPSMGNGQAT